MSQEFEKKTILVECDLRRPAITRSYLKDFNGAGLTDVLKGSAVLEDTITQIEGASLHLLPAGLTDQGAPELLSADTLRSVFLKLNKIYDFVIIDSPPILSMVDVNILSKIADGVVIVVKANKTDRNLVAKAANSIPSNKILGYVLNAAKTKLNKYYYY